MSVIIIQKFQPLEQITRPTVPTEQAAYYLVDPEKFPSIAILEQQLQKVVVHKR